MECQVLRALLLQSLCKEDAHPLFVCLFVCFVVCSFILFVVCSFGFVFFLFPKRPTCTAATLSAPPHVLSWAADSGTAPTWSNTTRPTSACMYVCMYVCVWVCFCICFCEWLWLLHLVGCHHLPRSLHIHELYVASTSIHVCILRQVSHHQMSSQLRWAIQKKRRKKSPGGHNLSLDLSSLCVCVCVCVLLFFCSRFVVVIFLNLYNPFWLIYVLFTKCCTRDIIQNRCVKREVLCTNSYFGCRVRLPEDK